MALYNMSPARTKGPSGAPVAVSHRRASPLKSALTICVTVTVVAGAAATGADSSFLARLSAAAAAPPSSTTPTAATAANATVVAAVAIVAASRAVASEIERGTLELVLAHPLSRRRYLAV